MFINSGLTNALLALFTLKKYRFAVTLTAFHLFITMLVSLFGTLRRISWRMSCI